MPGPHIFCDLGGTTRVRRELMARVVPLSSAVICIESITSLRWGGSSRAAIPGVCLALVQGSCSRKINNNYLTFF